MSSTAKVWGACRTLAVRSRPAAPRTQSLVSSISQTRWYADEPFNKKPTVQSSDPLAAAASLPAAPEGTPSDALGDEALNQIFYGGRTTPQEGDDGLTQAQEEGLYQSGRIPPAGDAEAAVEEAAAGQASSLARTRGRPKLAHKFPLPPKALPEDFNHKKRYHPVVDLMVRLIMRDGKLSQAQRHMATALNVLRTSPAPIYSPKFPLLPGTPPSSHLPLNPILYLTIAIDSVAPLLKVKHIPFAAGGGRALEMPTPLPLRTRRRAAFKWILDAVEKKPSKGSGRKQFGQRLAEEIIAVVEGRSGVWDKRKTLHKMGTTARVNVGKNIKVKKRN